VTTEAGDYAALGRKSPYDPWAWVTCRAVSPFGEPFVANRGLIDTMVEAMKAKHPTAEFKIELVRR